LSLASLAIGFLTLAAIGAIVLVAQGLLEMWRASQLAAKKRPSPYRVVTRREIGSDAISLELVPERIWRRAPRFKPGQHVVVVADIPGRGRRRRAYSLAAAPRGRSLELGVKREAGGEVSPWLVDEVKPGQKLLLLPPRGDFHSGLLKDAKAVALIAAGIGVTPFRAMLQQWLNHPPPFRVCLHLSARTLEQLYYHAEFIDMAARCAWLSYTPRVTGDVGWAGVRTRLSAQDVLAGLSGETAARILMCAGRAMETALKEGLASAGFAPSRVYSEAFGLALTHDDVRASVVYQGRGFEFQGEPTLLHALTAQGFDIPSECRVGDCGECRLRIAAGHARCLLTGRVERETVLTCCSVPSTDLQLD
jgi:ferredoxin-NADP reductase